MTKEKELKKLARDALKRGDLDEVERLWKLSNNYKTRMRIISASVVKSDV